MCSGCSKELISNVKLFEKYLQKNNVSMLWLTKTLLDQLYLLEPSIFRGIKYLLAGGEALNKDIVESILDLKRI